MNFKIVLTVAVFVTASFAVNATTTRPSVDRGSRSSTIGTNSDRPPALPQIVQGTGQASFVLTPLVVPERGPSGNWSVACGAALMDVYSNTVKFGRSTVSQPTDYAVPGRRVEWYNFCYSQQPDGLPFWNGRLKPVAPFNTEIGNTVWFASDMQSSTTNNDISLSMIQARFYSSEGSLNATNFYASDKYSTLAVGYKADGTPVTSGDATTLVNRIIMFVRSPLFNGAGTQAGLDDDHGWIDGQGVFTLTARVQVVGDDSTDSSATVSTAVDTAAVPILVPVRVDALGITFHITNADTNQTYFLQSRIALDAMWQNEGTLPSHTGPTNDIIVPFENKPFRVFRAGMR